MAKNSGDDIVPKWNGDLTAVDGYERDVKDVDWDRIEKDDGATELLRHVRQKLGAQPIQDAEKYLARWIFDLRRDTGEPMPSYISRDDEAYHDVVKGFDTEYFKKQRTARLSERAKEWNNLYGELNWFLYKIEQEGLEDAAEKAKELNTSLWRFVKTGLEEIPEHPDFGADFNQEAHGEGHDDYSYYEEHESEATYDGQGDEEDEGDPEEPLYSTQEIAEAETAFAAQQRSFEEGPGLDPEAQGHLRDEAAGADSDVTGHPDEQEIAPKDAEMKANLIANEMSRLRLDASLANKPVIKNRPKTANQKKPLDNNSYMPIERAIELRERVQHEKLPIWSTLEKAEDWILMSVKQSSSKGFGILDIGATSGIMGIE
ncbi:unnamed protein product, partial [Prorocentrum cordatum]